MAFEVACRCGARFAAEDHLSGRIVPCPSCRQPLSILSPSAAGVGYEVPPVLAPAAPIPSASPRAVSPASDSSQRFVFMVGGVGAGAVVMLVAVLIASSLLSSKDSESSALEPPLTTGQLGSSTERPGDTGPTSLASAPSASNASTESSKSPSAPESVASAIRNSINDQLGSPGFSTPEEAYEALRSAVRAQDWGKVYDCLVDEYRDRLISSEIVFLIIDAKTNPEAAAVLARFGITESKVQAAQLSKAGTKTIGITPKQIAAMRGIADDPRGFFADLSARKRQKALKERENPRSTRFAEDGLIDADRLENFRDLTIIGGKATGRMRGPNSVIFEKTARGWLVAQVSTIWGN